MKRFERIASYVRTAFLISVGIGMWALCYNIITLKRELHDIYMLHIHQAQQIDTLLNIRLREGREEDQEWLRKTREQYKDINTTIRK